MWELDYEERWTLKNWCFWTAVLEKTWESLGLQGESTSQILKEISPEYSLEGLMLKLKLQFFGYLMQRAYSLKKTLMLGKTEGRRRRKWQRMRWLDGITNVMDIWVGVWVGAGVLSRLQELVMDREACCATVHGVAKSWTRLSNWTDWKWILENGSPERSTMGNKVFQFSNFGKLFITCHLWETKILIPHGRETSQTLLNLLSDLV